MCDPKDVPCVLNPNSGELAFNMKLLLGDEAHSSRMSQRDERTNARRRENNADTFDHFINMMSATVGFGGLLAAAQEGEGEVETAGGTEEEAEAGTAISGQAIATSLGNVASALVPIITAASSLAISPVQLAQAVLAAVTAAAGVAGQASASPKAGA